MNAYLKLKKIFSKIYDLDHLANIACWDEAVMMPSGGGAARARALAGLQKIRHEILSSRRMLNLLVQAKNENLVHSWDRANLQWMDKIYHQANAIPASLVEKITKQAIECEQLWREKRMQNDWKGFAPALKKNLELTRAAAEIKSQIFNQSAYDILLDEKSPDLNQNYLDKIFGQLQQILPDLIQQIISKQKNYQLIPLQGIYPIEVQKKLGMQVMRSIGFDFEHGRLDVSHHPFCGGVPDDVRITTRYYENDFTISLMAVAHETGHAMYERGLPQAWQDQPVGQPLGMALHESQSLLVEMQACRSQDFIKYLSTILPNYFDFEPALTEENIYRLYTRVKPDLIRVNADEVTYPLHVIMRYEIEKKLITGDLTVDDIPEIWDAFSQKFFGISTKNNYKDGAMQDSHWAAGLFGYFPAYTIGALTAAQLYNHAIKAHPLIPENLAQGDFSLLIDWLRKNIHSQGSAFKFQDLLRNSTGEELDPKYYLNHIKKRYLETL